MPRRGLFGDTEGLPVGVVLPDEPTGGGIRSLILSRRLASSNDAILCPGSNPVSAENTII